MDPLAIGCLIVAFILFASVMQYMAWENACHGYINPVDSRKWGKR